MAQSKFLIKESSLTTILKGSLRYYFDILSPVFSNFLLVSGGSNGESGFLKNTEVLNFNSKDVQVPTYQNSSKGMEGAAGGFVANQFIICGGFVTEEADEDVIKQCYKIGINNTSLHGTMKEKRLYAASIALTDRLWILGGGDDYSGNILRSTEYISHDGRQEDGPDLPIALEDHAAIEINETHFMLLGGQTRARKR